MAELVADDLVRAAYALDLGGKTSLERSVRFVEDHADQLRLYDFVDDLALDAYGDEAPDRRLARKDAKALVHHLTVIRSAVARVLWTRQLFIDFSVLDELIFGAARRRDPDGPVVAVFRTIVERGLYHPGLVVYPLHGFGVLGAGFVHALTREHITLLSNEFGFAISPQTNAIDKTIAFLNEAREELGVRKAVPDDLLHHWERSRPARWMSRNPLLVAKVSTVPGGYYENQFLLVGRLRMITTLLGMLGTLQEDEATRAEVLFSSANINNFETLDIKHYMVLSDVPVNDEALEGQFVPMNASPLTLAELSDLPIEFNADHWIRNLDEARRVFAALNYVYEQHLASSFGPDSKGIKARVYRKLTQALTYFHRSYSKSHESWQSVVTLAIAFETLLTDSYSSGVRHRVSRRVGLLVSAHPQRAELIRAVDSMYLARGRLMHGEDLGNPETLVQARQAFIHAFVALVERLPAALGAAPPDAPMTHICGDIDERSRWQQRVESGLRRIRAGGTTLRRLIRLSGS